MLAAFRAGMQAAAEAGDRSEVDRLHAALRDVQALTIRPSGLAGVTAGWRLLILERMLPGLGRLHLIQDGRLIASTDTDTSALPTDRAHLRRFAEEMFGDLMDGVVEEEIDARISRPESWSPADSTILHRWLNQARSRLEIQRLRPDHSATRL